MKFSYLVELFGLLVVGVAVVPGVDPSLVLVRKERCSSMLRLSAFGPERHASFTSLEHFGLACAWTLAFLKSTTCPASGMCAHMCQLVSWLLTIGLCSGILVIRRFDVSPT